MVKLGENEKHIVCKKHVHFTKLEGKICKSRGEMCWNSENRGGN